MSEVHVAYFCDCNSDLDANSAADDVGGDNCPSHEGDSFVY